MDKQLSDNEKLRLMTEHEGWAVLISKFNDKCKELSDILQIKDTNELQVNQKALKVLLEWMQDIIGSVDLHRDNDEVIAEIDHTIIRYEQ